MLGFGDISAWWNVFFRTHSYPLHRIVESSVSEWACAVATSVRRADAACRRLYQTEKTQYIPHSIKVKLKFSNGQRNKPKGKVSSACYRIPNTLRHRAQERFVWVS